MQELKLKIAGLYTHPSDLGSAPDGALSVADDIVIDREQTAEPRRGFNRSSAALAANAKALFFYQGYIIALHSSNLLAYYSNTTSSTFGTSGSWTAIGGSNTYAPISGYKMRVAESNQNLYLTTSLGVYKTTSPSATPVLAGAYKALDVKAAQSASTSTWLTNNYRVAYRVVWGYKDANKNLILGAPSQRESFKNSAGSTKAVDVTFTIPAGVTTDWFYQVYRSTSVDNTTADIEPSDELGLVYEANPTAGEITAKSVTVTDITPDALRGATIYTAATQEGLTGGNEQPPMARDVAVYKNVLFYGNTTSKNRLTVTLLAAGGSSGVAVNDTITIGGVTYTGKSVETVASAQFRVSYGLTFTFADADVNTGTETITHASHGLSNGDPVQFSNSGGALPGGLATGTTYYIVSATTNTFQVSTTSGGAAVNITSAAGGGTHTLTWANSASQNIRDTAISLVRTINQYSSSTVYAYYLSGPDDLPGKILLEERTLGGAAFTVTASRNASWSPSLATNGTSSNDRFKNGLFYSKTSQPEAVPLTNFFFCGSAQKEILRIVPLRDSLFILKEDGIYRLVGDDSSNFRVELFDSTTKLIASNSVAVLNNQIYALTDQGVVSISESGIAVRSRPIEYSLVSLQGINSAILASESFGISYETERKYILFVPRVAGDTGCTQAFVFNVFTNSWTRWVLSKGCGGVNPADNKLYLGDSASTYVNQERKSYNFQDYVDYGFASVISAVNGRTLTLSGTDNIAAGDVIYQSATVYSIVESVNAIAGTATVQFTASFTTGAADVYKAISSKIAWIPVTFGNAGTLKHIREATLLFKQDYTGTGTLVFTSDVSPAQESETVTGTAIGLWGLFGWGNVNWGGTNNRRPIRVYIPRNKQRCSQLTIEFRHSTGYAAYQLNGLSLIANAGSERVAV